MFANSLIHSYIGLMTLYLNGRKNILYFYEHFGQLSSVQGLAFGQEKNGLIIFNLEHCDIKQLERIMSIKIGLIGLLAILFRSVDNIFERIVCVCV